MKLDLKHISLSLLILCLAPLIAFGRINKSQILDPSILTEEAILSAALKNSQRLQSIQTNADIAQQRYHASGWIANPEFRYGEEIHQYRADKVDERRYSIRWRVPELGELTEEKQKAKVNLFERKIQEQRYQDRLIARVSRTYVDVFIYDQLAVLAKNRNQIEERRIQIIKEMVDLGNRSVVYFTKAKMWHSESQNTLARALQRKNMERRKLAKQTGFDASVKLGNFSLETLTLDEDSLIHLALQNRPEIKLVNERIDLAIIQNRYEHLQLLPWFTFLEFSYHEELDQKEDWRAFKVGLDIPIFNWNIYNIKATRLAVRKKEDEAAAIRESIEEEVRNAYDIYKDLLLDWQNFKTYTDTLIQDAEAVIEQANRHQTLMADEVLEMELTIIDTKEIKLNKTRDLAHALIELYYTMGYQFNKENE